MKIEIDVSEENEGTAYPWWVIIDPKQNMSCSHDTIAHMITGPFFSRKEAERHLGNRRYAFGKNAVVYCMSGHWAKQYKEALERYDKVTKND